jgi:hypothetical protein
MSAIDTPDYQRGVVSAQVLLAEPAAGVASVTVGIPPNAETLIISASDAPAGTTVQVQGTSTLYRYPGKLAVGNPFLISAPTWFFDVSQPADEEVTITFSNAPGEGWVVYADSAGRVTVDAGQLANHQGSAYVIPTVPNVETTDHPPNELQFAGGLFSATGNIAAAPGAGLRLRVYSLTLSCQSGVTLGLIRDGGSGVSLIGCFGPGSNSITFPGQGVPLSTNEPLQYYLYAGANGALATAVYTTEHV